MINNIDYDDIDFNIKYEFMYLLCKLGVIADNEWISLYRWWDL